MLGLSIIHGRKYLSGHDHPLSTKLGKLLIDGYVTLGREGRQVAPRLSSVARQADARPPPGDLMDGIGGPGLWLGSTMGPIRARG